MLGRSARSSLNTCPNVLTNNEFLAIQDSSIVTRWCHFWFYNDYNDYNDYQKEQIIVFCALSARCNHPWAIRFFHFDQDWSRFFFIQDRSLFLASEITFFFFLEIFCLTIFFQLLMNFLMNCFEKYGRRESWAPELQKICIYGLKKPRYSQAWLQCNCA